MASRAERPLVLVDLAVPADVEREAGEVPGVSLFDVDDLRAGLDGAMAARLREVPKVEAVVEERGRGLRPPLPRARGRAASLRAAQAGRVDPRARARAGAEGPRARSTRPSPSAMEHLSRTLVKRLLHDPTVRARERAGAGNADEVADAVRDLFGLSAPSDR